MGAAYFKLPETVKAVRSSIDSNYTAMDELKLVSGSMN
jgi:hypothetical protein